MHAFIRAMLTDWRPAGENGGKNIFSVSPGIIPLILQASCAWSMKESDTGLRGTFIKMTERQQWCAEDSGRQSEDGGGGVLVWVWGRGGLSETAC